METVSTCGSRGLQAVDQLRPPLGRIVGELGKNEFASETIDGEAVLVVHLTEAAHTPTFEEFKTVMQPRLTSDMLEGERVKWLRDLRRSVRVDVRF